MNPTRIHPPAGALPGRCREAARIAAALTRSILGTIALGFGAGLAISAVLTVLVLAMATLTGHGRDPAAPADTAAVAAPARP